MFSWAFFWCFGLGYDITKVTSKKKFKGLRKKFKGLLKWLEGLKKWLEAPRKSPRTSRYYRQTVGRNTKTNKTARKTWQKKKEGMTRHSFPTYKVNPYESAFEKPESM
jgi:hypothetical protein